MIDRVSTTDIPSDAEWPRLARVPGKREAFDVDLYFREGWADCTDVFGAETVDSLGAIGLLSFKPDGVAARRTQQAVTHLADHGFHVLAMTAFRQTRHSIRELWRYNWDIYPVGRLLLSTLMHTITDTPVLLFGESDRGAIPTAVRLSDLKGSADPPKRRPGQLRYVLDPPNHVINFVHVADEPADLPRELVIMLDRPQRRRLLQEAEENLRAGTDITEAAIERLAELEGAAAANEFHVDTSLERLERSGAVTANGMATLRQALGDDVFITWDELIAIAPPDDARIETWDVVCVGAQVLEDERPGRGSLMPDSRPAEWAES